MALGETQRILITGGAGFIGTHLCSRLGRVDDRAVSVTVLDIQEPVIPIAGVRYVLGSIHDRALLESLIREADFVYHLAAIVSVPICQREPARSYETNLLGTAKVAETICLEQVRRGKAIPLVFSGSSVVYGLLGKRQEPLFEDAPVTQPLSFYGAQKAGSEWVLQHFHQSHGLPAMIFRFFNVYGPGQDPASPYSGVISIFSRQLLRGEPLRLHGGGEHTRDFVSVLDLVSACERALDIPHDRGSEGWDGMPINLGTGRAVSIRELSEMMKRLFSPTASVIQTAPQREGDVPHSLASIRRAKAILNWSPQIPLEVGLGELKESISKTLPAGLEPPIRADIASV